MVVFITELVGQEKSLDIEWLNYKHCSLATNTRSSYLIHVRTYLGFCSYFGYIAVPASQLTLCRYVAYLARRLSASSVRCYLAGIRHLHLELDYEPLTNAYHVTSVLKGIEVAKGAPPKQKLPITIEILQAMHGQLDLSDNSELCFWAACLVGFFTFARKSTLLTRTATSHCCRRDLCRRDFQFDGTHAYIRVKHSKTLQTYDRELLIPLPVIEGCILCPVTALLRSLIAANQPQAAPLFSYRCAQDCIPLTHSAFSHMLANTLTKCGYVSKDYSGHSLRRGGCSFALACGLPTEVIKAQGDWKSNAYERYAHPSAALRDTCAATLGTKARVFISK